MPGIALALVLPVDDATGSFASAGLAVGGFAVGAGAVAPPRGRLVDRRGAPALLGLGPRSSRPPARCGPGSPGPDLTRAVQATNALLVALAAVVAPALVGLLAATAGPGVALAAIGSGPPSGASWWPVWACEVQMNIGGTIK